MKHNTVEVQYSWNHPKPKYQKVDSIQIKVNGTETGAFIGTYLVSCRNLLKNISKNTDQTQVGGLEGTLKFKIQTPKK